MLQHTLSSLPDVLSEVAHGAFRDMGELWYFIQGGQKRLRRHFNLLYDCFGWHVDILGKTFPPASGNEEGVALATYSHSHASGQSSSVIGDAEQIVERSSYAASQFQAEMLVFNAVREPINGEFENAIARLWCIPTPEIRVDSKSARLLPVPRSRWGVCS